MSEKEVPPIKFLFMELNQGITRPNILAMFVVNFLISLILYVKVSVITYLLVTNYNVTQQDSGKVAGKLGLYGTFSILPFELILGTLMDLLGRKVLTIGGLFMCGSMFALMT